MSDVPVDLKSNTNYVLLKNLQDEPVVPRTSLAAVDLVAGNGMRVAGSTIYTADASAYDIIYGTSGSGVITPAGLKAAMDEGFLAAPDIATVDDILSGSTGQMVDPNGLNSALKVAQAVDVSTLGATTMDGDVSVLNYLDTFTLVGTWDSAQDPNVWVTNKYGFGINGTGDYDPTKYPKYAAGLRYIFIMDIKLVSGQFASIMAMNNGRRQNLLIDGGSLSDYNWHRYAFEFDSNAAYFIINITKNSSVQLKNVRQYEVTALTDDAIKALAGFEDPDDFEYSHIIDQNMINPWLQIIDMGSSPEVLVYPGLSYRINAQSHNVKLHVPSMPANKSGLDSYVELYVGGEGSVAVQRPLVLGATITPYSTNQCTVKFRDGRAVLTIDEVSQDYVVTVTSGVEGSALEGSLYYGLVNSTANQIAFNSGLDGQEISLPAGATVGRAVTVYGNGMTNTTLNLSSGGIYAASNSDVSVHDLAVQNSITTHELFDATQNTNGKLTIENCIISGNTSSYWNLVLGGNIGTLTLENCYIINNRSASTVVYCSGGRYGSASITNCYFSGNNIWAATNVYALKFGANNTQVQISGTTFMSGDKIGHTDASSNAILSSLNVINSTITGPGITTLTATSILDLSNNIHAAVASGGTVSAAAGAKIIALGGNTVTISANTSGSYLLNNGTITSDVYIVTTSGSSTGSGSLIYGMTASSAGNILFDSGVDGQTVTLPEGSTNSRLVHIIGNGADQTILGGSSLLQTNNPLYLSGMCIKTGVNSNVAAAPINLTNCKATGYTNASSPIFTVYPAATKPTNCEIYSNICLNVGYGGPYIGCNIHDNTIYKHIMLNSVARDCQFVNNVYAGSDVSSVQSGACMANYATNVYIMNCYFNNPQMYYAFRTDYNTRAGEVLILGSTFASNGDALYSTAAGAKYIFADTNVFNSYLQCVTAVVNLVTGSTLDLSANTNSVVVYGSNPTTAAITGTTINVVASTASDAAIGGTATVLYNDNGVTKSRTLSGGGAGYIMRNNGAWGVPVTTKTAGQSGSLDTLLADTNISNVTFAPVVDIDTPTTGGTISLGTNITRTDSAQVSVNGAGIDKTTLTGSFYTEYVAYNDCTITALGFYGSQNYVIVSQLFKNCKITNCTDTTHGYAVLTGPAYNCLFENNNRGARTFLYYYNTLSNCVSRNNISTGGFFWSEALSTSITDCIFQNDTDSVILGIKSGNNSSSTTTITGCTFGYHSNIIVQGGMSAGPGQLVFSGTNILNSTVSGAGTVVFADGATVTSTIPSGSTIGTGAFDLTSYPNQVFYTINNNTIAPAVFKGLTFKNKSGSLTVFPVVGNGTTYTLEDCRFTGNICNNKASSMMCFGGTVSLTRCYFIDNDQPVGFGDAAKGKILLTDCVFSGNTMSSYSINWGTDVASHATASGKLVTLYILGGNTFGGSIVLVNSGIINISGTNVFKERIRTRPNSMTEGDASTYATLRIASGSIIDMNENQQSFYYINISVGHYEGDTWVVGSSDTASVIPYGGGTPVTISGSGTTLSNMGVLS